ncbi:MAG: HDIG domain-containing protein [Syntrophomonadaceae bacterium]|nr:HDIG domain-containing protein [Syntrophomonadaceae bacterium]
MKLVSIFKYFFGEKLGFFWKDSGNKRFLGLSLFFIIMFGIIFGNFSPQQVTLRTDEVAKRDIVSNINAVIVDEKQTEELRQQAAEKVQKSYQEDQFALPNARTEIDNFFANIKDILQSDNTDKKTPLKNLLDTMVRKKTVNADYDTNVLANYLVNTKPQDIEKMQAATVTILETVMDKPITEEALAGVYKEASQQADKIAFNPTAIDIIKLAAVDAIQANLIYNQEATDKAVKDAKDAVEPVRKTVKTGEIIVREGDRITAEQISVLEQLGIQRTQSYTFNMLGIGAFILITLWLVREYLQRYHKDIYKNDALLLLLGLILVLVFLIARFITVIQITDRPEINAMSGYLAPVAAGSMLIAILIDNRLAYFMTMIMALLVGLLTETHQLAFVTAAFVSGTVGVYRVTRLSQTSDLAKAGFYIALADVATILAMTFIEGNITIGTALIGSLLGLISGILSAILMIGALPYLESGFSITSMIKLLELTNPNHDLLKRLLIEAPGTYHHSLMVGNLAEAAAEPIGANPLLVRVGAYYHDIGKIKRSEYFVENQRGFDEPHDKIAPALSALIITSHVKEGVELARAARLPQVIIDFIAEHHGTSLAKYFYNRAIEEEGEDMVNEDSFRYEGPKPQTKEVALVMLADAVEAAVRSLTNPNMDSIRAMIRKILRDKLNDGQLDESNLTFKDLDVIANTFSKVLEGVYHKRIEYPDIVQEFTKRRERYGYDDNKPAEPS